MPLLSTFNRSLDRPAVAHLLRRATFGATHQQIDQYVGKTASQIYDALTAEVPNLPIPRSPSTGEPWQVARKEDNERTQDTNSIYFVFTWMDHLCRSPLSLSEKMVFFHHSFFTTRRSKASEGVILYQQNQLFRHYALGNMKDLAFKICYDNAMIQFLDGSQNFKGRPNENFAREFLELYSLGKKGANGKPAVHYTEQDVQQAARVFSGFYVDYTVSEIDPETKIPMGRLRLNHKGEASAHDFGAKTFSAEFDNRVITPKAETAEAAMEEIREFVDMVFARRETARHIARRLYRYFVYHQIDDRIEQEVVQPLADALLKNNYEIKPVLRMLLSSQHFYDQGERPAQRRVRGALIKSPLELIVNTMRYFKVPLPARNNVGEHYALMRLVWNRMQAQGMDLYDPVVVAGYPAYHQSPLFQRSWISSSALAYRYKFSYDIVASGLRRKQYPTNMQADALKYVQQPENITKPDDAKKLVQELVDDLFARSIDQKRLDYFEQQVLLDDLSPINWEFEWKKYREGEGEEYAEGLRSQLNKLMSSMMQTPEYQLC